MPDEYEIALLTVVTWLRDAETMPEDRFLRIDLKTASTARFVSNPKQYIDQMRSNRKTYADAVLNLEGVKLRAKLALREIAAIVSPDEIIPGLVTTSISYLGCSFVQRWIRQQKQMALAEKKSVERDRARSNLEQLSTSIKGNYRSIRRRKYSYWRLGLIYANLSSKIRGARQHHAAGTLDRDFFIKDWRYPCHTNFPQTTLDETTTRF